MAAHSLEVSRTEYLRLIAAHANWNRDPSVWSNDQETDGFDILKEALTQFYFPQVLPGDRVPWEWRFLWLADDLTVRAAYSTGTAESGGTRAATSRRSASARAGFHRSAPADRNCATSVSP